MSDPRGREIVEYDEFGLFHENATEFGLAYYGPPQVGRVRLEVEPGRSLSALVWGDEPPELVLIHGGAQNAHTWDTVAMALQRPLVAIDLPGHGHSDGPGPLPEGQLSTTGNAADVAAVIRELAPKARAVVGMSLGGLTSIALAGDHPELVRRLVLVDVTPGVNGGKAQAITAFVNGPASMCSTLASGRRRRSSASSSSSTTDCGRIPRTSITGTVTLPSTSQSTAKRRMASSPPSGGPGRSKRR